MSTTLAAQAGRTTTKITVVSAVAHLAAAGFAAAATAWGFAGFCALGLVATLLAWASVTAGRTVWNVGVAVLVVSLGVLVWTLTGDDGLGVVAIAIPLLFIDWVLYANAHRAIG